MALNINSNIGASIALRALHQSDRAMTASLSKLSSGSRVQSAKDDAAALAIGSRLKAEISALKTVSNNATQGVSMLQIAEGAYARATDMVTRMRAISAQAASSHLSSTERAMLNTEFQAIKAELSRMAAATTFNGNRLVNSSLSYTFDGNEDPSFTGGLLDLCFYDATVVASSGTFDWSASNIGSIYFFHPDGTQYLFLYANNPNVNPSGVLTARTTFQIINADTGIAAGHITLEAATDLGSFWGAGLEFSNNGYTTSNVKVGISTSNNTINTYIFGITTTNLGLSSSNLTSVGNANSASYACKYALDAIARARSIVAASQNRMEAAQQNSANIVENLESARSAYMDLDVAAEMSIFTSKRILVQAGISMIAQAGRETKNLLRLFK